LTWSLTLAHRLVVLNKGSIEQIGTPLEFYHNPASTFVASFIGSPAMNLLNARLDGNRLMIDEAVLQLSGSLPSYDSLTVGIRPEDLVLAQNGENPLSFMLDHVEELGAQRLVHGMVGEQRITAAFPPQLPISDHMQLTAAVDKLHFFSADTGKRLITAASQVVSQNISSLSLV
jgi:sn-glycerol 3-phosphate transport system ATP-binding protein